MLPGAGGASRDQRDASKGDTGHTAPAETPHPRPRGDLAGLGIGSDTQILGKIINIGWQLHNEMKHVFFHMG